MSIRGSPIVEYGGEICGSSPSEAQSRKVAHLRRSRSPSSSQVECARQRYDLDRVSSLPVSCYSRETGLLDRYRTIKRGSRLSFSVSVGESSNHCILGISSFLVLIWFFSLLGLWCLLWSSWQAQVLRKRISYGKLVAFSGWKYHRFIREESSTPSHVCQLNSIYGS